MNRRTRAFGVAFSSPATRAEIARLVELGALFIETGAKVEAQAGRELAHHRHAYARARAAIGPEMPAPDGWSDLTNTR